MFMFMFMYDDDDHHHHPHPHLVRFDAKVHLNLWWCPTIFADFLVLSTGELAALRADRDGAARGASPTREESVVDPLREEAVGRGWLNNKQVKC